MSEAVASDKPRRENARARAKREEREGLVEEISTMLRYNLVKGVMDRVFIRGPERPYPDEMWKTLEELLIRRHWWYVRDVPSAQVPESDYERFLKRQTWWEARAKRLARHRGGPEAVVDESLPDAPPAPSKPWPYKAEHQSWTNAKRRCYDEACSEYRHYGGRGITVHAGWLNGWEGFRAFLEHIGPKPGKGYSLDRIDNNRGYEPGNVRWASWVEQANNRRNNRHVILRGERMTAADLARRIGAPDGRVVVRWLNRGKTPEEIEARYAKGKH